MDSPLKRCEVPKGKSHRAEIYLVDDSSYFHVAFKDEQSEARYHEMSWLMDKQVKTEKSTKKKYTFEDNQLILIEYNSKRGGKIARARMISSKGKTQSIHLVDDKRTIKLFNEDLFPMSLEIANFSKFTLKCKLKGLEFFEGHGFVKSLYDHYTKRGKIPSHVLSQLGRYEIHSDNWFDAIPTISIKTYYREELSEILLEYIPTFDTLMYPPAKTLLEVEVLHFDGKNTCWVYPIVKKSLLKFNLREGLLGGMKKLKNVSPADVIPEIKVGQGSYKNLYLSQNVAIGGEVMFLYKGKDTNLYRVRKLQSMGCKIAVFYVDFGKIELIDEREVCNAFYVDQILALAPAQCLPVTFISGEVELSDISYTIRPKVLDTVKGRRTFIIIKDEITRGTQHSTLHASFIDHLLDFLPHPARGINFPNCTRNLQEQFLERQRFMELIRGKPVHEYIRDFISLIESHGGRITGEIMIPQADILFVHGQNLYSLKDGMGLTSKYKASL